MKIVVDGLSDEARHEVALVGVHTDRGHPIAELQVDELLDENSRHRGYRVKLLLNNVDAAAFESVIEGI